MTALFKQINSNTLGDKLKEQRLNLGINLKKASRDLGIARKYLEALENQRLNDLPDKSYFDKFLIIYCEYLELNSSEIFKLKKELVINNKMEKISSFSLYNFIVKSFFLSLFLGLIFFIGYNVLGIFSSPKLKIITPEDGTITYQRQLNIKGITDLESEVFINNRAILLEQDGEFSANLDLQSGLNLITITAKKKYSRQREIELKILFKD